MKTSRILMTLILISLSSPVAHATDNSFVQRSAWQALNSGQAVLLMRHALAPGIGDPAEFTVDDCTTQRNLSDAGRRQAVAIGELLRANLMSEAQVITSAWCRCRDTAELLDVGTYEVDTSLNSFFRNYSVADAQTANLKNKIQAWIKAADVPRILVTHQVNISALTGMPTGSGDMVIVTVEGNKLTVLSTVSAPAAR